VPQAPFDMESAQDGEKRSLRLTGELDIATVPRVEQAVERLLSARPDELMLDLGGLDFVDSSGLRMCVALHQRAGAEGWRLSMRRPAEQALAVFRMSGVEATLPFVEDASAA
jgi:anti-anti-sigma factor